MFLRSFNRRDLFFGRALAIDGHFIDPTFDQRGTVGVFERACEHRHHLSALFGVHAEVEDGLFCGPWHDIVGISACGVPCATRLFTDTSVEVLACVVVVQEELRAYALDACGAVAVRAVDIEVVHGRFFEGVGV